MKWEQVTDNWRRASDRIRITWGKLSDTDIPAINGNRQQLSSMLQERYRFHEIRVEEMIVHFTEDPGNAVN